MHESETFPPADTGNSSPELPQLETDQPYLFPCAPKNILTLHDHKKTVSALSIDHSGSRFISGGHDYSLRFWDFNGLDGAAPKPFRTLEEPCGGHNIRDLAFAPKGGADKVLVIPCSAQAKIMTRDGAILTEFIKGDQYLIDMKNTKGHTTSMNCGIWNPTNPQMIATAANDSTVRFWDINDHKKQKGIIVVKSRLPGTKSPVTCIRYSLDGKSIYTAAQDGSIKHWLTSASYNYTRPLSCIDSAHESGKVISDIQLSADKTKLISRSLDGSMKIWDTRKFKDPLHKWDILPAIIEESSAIFANNEKYIMTGVSADPSTGTEGSIHIYNTNTFELMDTIECGNISPVKIVWHENLFQSIVGFSDGTIRIYYDDDLSNKGAKLVKVRKAKSEEFVVTDSRPNIYTPHSLPLFRSESTNLKRQREKARKDPVKSHRPELPVDGPGRGGKIGNNLTQHLVKNINLQNNTRDEDPREALLKYAKLAAEDPRFITPAYQVTQPKILLSDKTVAQEEEPEEEENI